MGLSPARVILLLLFGGAGVFLLTRALAGGGPLYYFLSAVFLGMAYASTQRGTGGKGGRGQ